MKLKLLSSLPLYIKWEDINQERFNQFIDSLSMNGMYGHRIKPNYVRISDEKDSQFNNIFIRYPAKSEFNNGMNFCKFFNADYTPTSPLLRLPLEEVISLGFQGFVPDNCNRILSEPFCERVLSLFLKYISVYRCEKCNGFSFTKEAWKEKDSLFTADRVGHMVGAAACILFLRGHGAGYEWSKATSGREKREGYTLTCCNCHNSISITTDTERL